MLGELWQHKGKVVTKWWFLNQILKFNSEFGLGQKIAFAPFIFFQVRKLCGNLLDETKLLESLKHCVHVQVYCGVGARL